MKRRTKIILASVAIVIALCVLLPTAIVMSLPRVAPSAIAHDKERVKQIAQKIADYTLPEGIVESEATDLFLFQDVWFFSTADDVYVEFFQLSVPAIARRFVEEEENDYVYPEQANCEDAAIQNVSSRWVFIKGRRAPFLLWDCRGDQVLRYATGQFSGKGGGVQVTMINPSRAWNWKLFDQFFGSIR